MTTSRVAALTLACVGLSACGFGWGSVRDANSIHSFNYDMSKGFRFLRTVRGVAHRNTVLCIIPDDSTLYADAMDGLHAEADMGLNQALVNLREDTVTRSYLGLYCTTTLTLSADLVTFGSAAEATPVPERDDGRRGRPR